MLPGLPYTFWSRWIFSLVAKVATTSRARRTWQQRQHLRSITAASGDEFRHLSAQGFWVVHKSARCAVSVALARVGCGSAHLPLELRHGRASCRVPPLPTTLAVPSPG
ncbi:unnamed protein product [Lampetra planeri]